MFGRTNRLLYWLIGGMCSFVLASVFLTTASAQTITQGFGSDTTLLRGSIVAVTLTDKNKIELVSRDQIDRMFGVVVNSNDSAVTLSSGQEALFVATNGRYDVLVSDQNGSVKTGDFLTLSSINGVAMKAEKTDRSIVGRAVVDVDFSKTDTILSKQTITSVTGSKHEVSISRVLTDISIGRNPQYQDKSVLPSSLRRFGESVSGKPVSTIRIFSALAVMLVVAIIATSLIYSGVRSSLVAIGRNPLSKKSILQGLVQVVIIGVVILLFGLGAMYLILKL